MHSSMKMWNASNVEELSKGSRKYDNCGFKITPSLVNVTNASRHFIIPSETFTGFLDIKSLTINFIIYIVNINQHHFHLYNLPR